MANKRPDIRGFLLKDCALAWPRDFSFKPIYKSNEYIGLEVETEGYNLPDPSVMRYLWSAKADGSLREASVSQMKELGATSITPWEYVLRRPVSPATAVKRALPYLAKQFAKTKATPDFSGRCSVHVHVGVHELYLYQIYAMVGMYYILEDLLYDLVGQERDGNHFCLGASHAYAIVDSLVKAASEEGWFRGHDGDKYSAVNLLTLYKLGTVEFRSMEGTLDLDRISTWIEFLTSLRQWASKLTPDQMPFILSQLSMGGPADVVADILGPNSKSYAAIFKSAGSHIALQSQIYKGIGRMQPLFYEPDWANIKLGVPEPAPEKPTTKKNFQTAQEWATYHGISISGGSVSIDPPMPTTYEVDEIFTEEDN